MHMQEFDAKWYRMQEVAFDTRGESQAEPPLEFETGMGAVPEAVDMSVRLMTPQEVAIITAAPAYAYQGRSDCPPVSACLMLFWL